MREVIDRSLFVLDLNSEEVALLEQVLRECADAGASAAVGSMAVRALCLKTADQLAECAAEGA
jgi:hypothetical protein